MRLLLRRRGGRKICRSLIVFAVLVHLFFLRGCRDGRTASVNRWASGRRNSRVHDERGVGVCAKAQRGKEREEESKHIAGEYGRRRETQRSAAAHERSPMPSNSSPSAFLGGPSPACPSFGATRVVCSVLPSAAPVQKEKTNCVMGACKAQEERKLARSM